MTDGRPAGGAGPAIKSPLARDLQAAIDRQRAGRFDDAERLYNEILAAHPEQPDALQFLGVLAGQRGTPEAAIDYLTRAIAVKHRNPVYHYNLGLAYQAAGRMENSSDSFRQVLELKSDHVGALKGLGWALLMLNRLEEAELCCRKVIKMAPQDPRARNNLAAVLFGRESIDEAEACAREALRLMPNFAEAHNNLGNTFLAQETYDEAAECYRKALRLSPQYTDAHHNLGVALRGLGKPVSAMASLREAIEIRPDYAEAHCSLASTYRLLGFGPEAEYEYREALRHKSDYAAAAIGLANVLVDKGDLETSLSLFEEVLRRDPKSEKGLAGTAEILERKGDLEASYAIVRPIIDAGNPPPGIVAVFSTLARRFGREDDAITIIEEMLATSDLIREQQNALSFRLARLYDVKGEFDLAFRHYSKGNELKTTPFDPSALSEWVKRITEFYTKENVARLPRSTNESESPVFVVGMPRSGTSLTEQILSSHPKVCGAGELEDIPLFLREIAGGPGSDQYYPECLTETDSVTLDTIAERHLDKLRERDDGAARFTDKMPYNFLYLGFISQLFPKARVIHCVRDPLDTCLSCFFQNFARGNFQTYDLRHLGGYYVQYQRLMRHWHEVLDIPIMDLVYEDLVADLEGKSRELVDFVGLDWDPQCLRFHESKRIVNTASYDQVRQPIYTRSVERWRHYERHLGPLKEALAGAG